jgi:hypothetical protein
LPAWWNRQKGLRNKYTKFERDDPERGHLIWDSPPSGDFAEPVYIGAIASQNSVQVQNRWIRDKQPMNG